MLLVLWYHVWEISWLPAPWPAIQFVPETGFIGVDLFFFISGFVIAFPFVRAQLAREAPQSWSHFFYRRGIKIVPSYILSIALLIAIGYAHFASPGEAARDIVTHVLFIHTWWPDTYGAINGVLWTLAVEVQFYVIFPALWWAFSRRPWLTAAALIAVAWLFRVEAGVCCLQTHAEQMIDNLPGYLDIFAIGMLGAWLYVRSRERMTQFWMQIVATSVAFAGFLCLILLLQNLWSVRLEPEWSTAWQIDHRTFVAVAFLAIALGSLLAVAQWQRALANPILLFFGIISYNLYLYHQALARELLAWRFPNYSGDPHHDPAWQVPYTLIAFGVTIAFAGIVTYAFERPLLRMRAPTR